MDGHRFDVNRRGWLTAIDARAGVRGDPRPLLEARRSFLAAGHYCPIAEAIRTAAPLPSAARVIDAGCGTGYYSAALLAGRRDARALELDASADAVRLAVAATGMPGIVADIWRPWPVRDAVADAVLCVFAPRNAAESARVLRPGGVLITVTPTERHLVELQRGGSVLTVPAGKREALAERLAPFLRRRGEPRRLEYRLELDGRDAGLLAAMGPAGHHDRAAPGAGPVTVSVEVAVFAPRATG
ncbi:MAG: methyltransferase domain-containing protein [Microbacteriaceae bacterium]